MPAICTILLISLSTVKGYSSVITLHPSKDNTLFQSVDEHLSNGAGPHVFSGATLSFGLRRALLYFDISKIPSSAKIVSAKLTLFMDRTAVGSFPISLHRLLDHWGESDSIGARGGGLGGNARKGDVTWLYRYFPDIFWNNPGGDFLKNPSATAAVDTIGQYEWSSDRMLNDIKLWLTNSETNAGWILIGEEDTDTITTKRFVSKDSNSIDQRPALQIFYEIPSTINSNTWATIKVKKP
ncbi:MAG: hypothetical protein VX294_09980 [Candidatus Latescibacterota bacterium]|nr:hypothetical protein [Candidatus Latescibacterota bacterium]